MTEWIKAVRYCPDCGRIGEVGPEFRDCCPDGSHSQYVRPEIAEQARAGFDPRCKTCGGSGSVWKSLRHGESDWQEWEDDCPDCEATGCAVPMPPQFDEAKDEALKLAREAFFHIGEYWNGDRNDLAMSDALAHIEETADKALATINAALGEK